MPTKPDVLEVRDLKVHFPLRGGVFQRLSGRDAGAVKAVDGVSFTLAPGEVLGVVGESGSGKTTLGRAIVGMAPLTSGSLFFEGREVGSLTGAARRAERRWMRSAGSRGVIGCRAP